MGVLLAGLEIVVAQRAEEGFPLVATQQRPDVEAVLGAGVRPKGAVPSQVRARQRETGRERERERERERDRQTDRDTETQRHKDRGT
eukprot:COSAG03_NODE_5964_length_1140_cov_13.676273_1_plen_87_part_00